MPIFSIDPDSNSYNAGLDHAKEVIDYEKAVATYIFVKDPEKALSLEDLWLAHISYRFEEKVKEKDGKVKTYEGTETPKYKQTVEFIHDGLKLSSQAFNPHITISVRASMLSKSLNIARQVNTILKRLSYENGFYSKPPLDKNKSMQEGLRGR